jgi:hypothetical protein
MKKTVLPTHTGESLLLTGPGIFVRAISAKLTTEIAARKRDHCADANSLRHRRGVAGLARQLEKTANILMRAREIASYQISASPAPQDRQQLPRFSQGMSKFEQPGVVLLDLCPRIAARRV